MRKLNTAQKIILVIGLIALAIRFFAYDSRARNELESVVFHCLGIISATSILMLLAGFFGDRLEPYLADKRKWFLWIGIPAAALVTWGVCYYLKSHPRHPVLIQPYSIQPSKIELFDMKIDTDKLDRVEYNHTLSGRVKNNSSMEIYEIELHILVYNSEGKYIDTGIAEINPRITFDDYLLPGEVRSFRDGVFFVNFNGELHKYPQSTLDEKSTTQEEKTRGTRNTLYDQIVAEQQKEMCSWNYNIISVKGRK